MLYDERTYCTCINIPFKRKLFSLYFLYTMLKAPPSTSVVDPLILRQRLPTTVPIYLGAVRGG